MAAPQNQNQNQAQVVVVMVPFPPHGHLNPLLHLSHHISTYNIPVHFVGAATHIRQAQARAQGWDPATTSKIHFHEFQSPTCHSPPPDQKSSTESPSQIPLSLIEESTRLRDPVGKFISSLSPTAKRVVVIHDPFMVSVVQDLVLVPNAEGYAFHVNPAFFIYAYKWEAMGRPSIDADLYNILNNLPTMAGCASKEVRMFAAKQIALHTFNSGNIIHSSRAIESHFIDLLSEIEVSGSKKHWALGPINPVAVWQSPEDKIKIKRNVCLEWLDNQAPDSVIYVCFGTTTSLSDEEIYELATGLERSEQKFIWVLRHADKGVLSSGDERKAQLPNGFEERDEGKGIVVRDWVPQLDILGHPATGGFLSHCGSGSCMESISMGVPIAAWPMHSDQPRCATLITEVLKIGTVVKDWALRDQLITSFVIEKAIRKLMASEEGDKMRKRAKELSEVVRRSLDEGGVSRLEFESFIAHISR